MRFVNIIWTEISCKQHREPPHGSAVSSDITSPLSATFGFAKRPPNFRAPRWMTIAPAEPIHRGVAIIDSSQNSYPHTCLKHSQNSHSSTDKANSVAPELHQVDASPSEAVTKSHCSGNWVAIPIARATTVFSYGAQGNGITHSAAGVTDLTTQQR